MVNKVLLKDIATITTGSTAPKDKYFSNNGLPFIRAGHLETLIDKNNINELPKIDDETGKQLKLKKVNKGTILFAKSGMSSTKNRVYICTEDAYIVNHLAAIIPDSRFIDNYFLKFFLEWFKPSRLIIDESYPSIRTADIGNIEIQLPSLENQMKIVKILNKAKLLIKTRKAQIEALDQLTQSVFLEMFGDPIINSNKYNTVSLKDLCINISGGGTPSKSKPEYYLGEIPWVTPKDMKRLLIDNSLQHISKEAIENSSAKIIPNNSVLMVIRSGILKKKLPLAINTREVAVNQDMKAFTVNKELINPEYLLFFFMFYQRKLLGKVRSVTADNLDFNDVKKIPVPVPKIELQNHFSKIFYDINKQKNKFQEQLTLLENNFNSLLQRAFKGELFTER